MNEKNLAINALMKRQLPAGFTESNLKNAKRFRKMQLLVHPNRALHRVQNATKAFQELQRLKDRIDGLNATNSLFAQARHDQPTSSFKYYVHDYTLPLRDAFTTKDLKGLVAHDIVDRPTSQYTVVGDPIPSDFKPKRIPVKTTQKGKHRTKCAVVSKALEARSKHRLYDPIFDDADLAECRQQNPGSEVDAQLCMMQKACFLRGLKERGWDKEKRNEYIKTYGTFDVSIEPFRKWSKTQHAGTATFCCTRNFVKMMTIKAHHKRILDAVGAGTAEEQVKLRMKLDEKPAEEASELKPDGDNLSRPTENSVSSTNNASKNQQQKKVPESMIREEQAKEDKLIQTIVPLTVASEYSAATKATIAIAIDTIEYIRVETQKRIEQIIAMVDGFNYTPGKRNKIITALTVGGATGGATYSASGASMFGAGTSAAASVGGAIYGYARGSTGVIKDIVSGLKMAADKILSFVTYVLRDPRRSAYMLEAFVMIKKILCSSISRAIHKEPIEVQKSLFEVGSDNMKYLTENGTFVVKRIFVENMGHVFSGKTVSNLTGLLSSMTGMGPIGGATVGFLSSVVGNVVSEAMEIYAQQAFLEHFFHANSDALNDLVFGSCIAQPVKVTMSSEKTLATVSDALSSSRLFSMFSSRKSTGEAVKNAAKNKPSPSPAPQPVLLPLKDEL